MITTSCASDVSDVADASESAAPVSEVVSETTLARPTTVPPSTTTPTNSTEMLMTAASDFSGDLVVGTFEVPEGADGLGCESGSFVDTADSEGVARLATCESGDRSGTFTVLFVPGDGPGPGDLNGPWNVESATGDFAGLQGEGDFSVVFDDENGTGAETLSGSIEFGPVDETTTPTVSGEITISAAAEWAEDSGSFEVVEGADVIDCASGSYTEQGLATTFERVYICESGDRTGTFTVHFGPEPGDEPGTFASEWTVEGSTGDFAGLQGDGDFLAVVNDDDTGADETWTGEIGFGTPDPDADDVAGEAEPFDGVLDEAFLTERVEQLQVPDDVGAILVSVIDADGSPVWATGGNGPDGATPTSSDPFRIGSITKVFTSLTTLSLVEEGLIALDDPVVDHVTRVDVPADLTIRDLLQHTSGIANYTDGEDFFEVIMEDAARRWTPEEMVALSSDVDDPGAQAAADTDGKFSYSNTNYVVLGIMIEEVTGEMLHDVVRARVTDVAGMPTTYLAGYEDGAEPFGAFVAMDDEPVAPIDFDYTSIATSAWSAGAMVSSADDLHRLFTALYDGEIMSDVLLAEMTANEQYGLGIELWDEDKTLVGHGGSIPGYETLVFHAPESGQTAFWAVSGDGLQFGPLVDVVVEAMVPELREDD